MASTYSIEDVPVEIKQLAVRAATAIGADYSGVDVIEGVDGRFYVLETNEFPGFGERTAPYLGRYIVDTVRQQKQSPSESESYG